MNFVRRFTPADASPYHGIAFAGRPTQRHPAGVVTAPADWSQTAVDIIAGKYMRKAGVPLSHAPKGREGNLPVWLCPTPAAAAHVPRGAETDARQVFDRLAGFWSYWGWKLGYFSANPQMEDYRQCQPGHPAYEAAAANAAAFYDELRAMLVRQMAAPASPQWFNAGLHWAYGISGDDCGQWAINFIEDVEGEAEREHKAGFDVKPSADPYRRPALSACFIQSVADNLVEKGGIHDLMRREALVFKYGGGSGSNWSAVRAAGEPLAGGGQSSGLLSFLQAPDKSAGAIKSGGTTRRAARMLCLDDDHPELPEFVRWKAGEEKKVAALVAGSAIVAREVDRVYRAAKDYADAPNDDASPATAAAAKRLARWRKQAAGCGVPKAIIDAAAVAGMASAPCPEVQVLAADFEGEAYNTVSGQNANNSVRVSNDFMRRAAGPDRSNNWPLYGRVEKRKAQAEGRDPQPARTVNAADTLDQMAQAAWECGCPGWQYDTTINEWNPCLGDSRIRAANPCGEYNFLDDTACNLASLNLLFFFFLSGGIDLDGFLHAVRLWTVVLDITVSAAGYPSQEVADGSRKYRTLGLGYTNLGALLMRRGIPYDSDAGRAWAGHMTALLHYGATVASAELAAELGAFPRFADNRDDVLRVVHNHAHYGMRGGSPEGYKGLTFQPAPLSMQPGCEAVPVPIRVTVDHMARRSLAWVEWHGLRNAQLTLLAPNGTIGLLMDSDTTGIEPDFALVKFKKLAGGGYLKIVNQSVAPAMAALGYSDEDAETVRRWVVGRGELSADLCNRLQAFGLRQELIAKANDAVTGAMKLADCFAPWVIGEDEFRRVGLDPQRHGGRHYLTAAGFDRDAVRALSHDVCGHLTVEGCPVLKAEHLSVFDCANRCGPDGARSLSVAAHLHMMAAAQPVLSGAISKTVNFPADATPADFRAAAVEAWTLALKAMAGYRDGSKMAQPLNTDSDEADDAAAEPVVEHMPLSEWDKPVGPLAYAIPAGGATPPAQPPHGRRKLPNRVKGERVKFNIVGASGRHKFYLRCGDYPDGHLGEIFIDAAKEGAMMRGILNAFAMAVSIGLQHGVPLEEYVEALTFTKFEPNGPIVGHDRLRRCDSIVDAIFRELAITYLKRDDLAHVTPEPATAPAVLGQGFGTIPDPADVLADPDSFQAISRNQQVAAAGGLGKVILGEPSAGNYAAAKAAESRSKGYTGNRCPRCKSLAMIRCGACERCDDCGDQSGCV
jgi:ribonucleoside-diphosphate reductase alpha chain